MSDFAPVRIQLSRRRGWRMPDNTVKVDRTTPWGNPFSFVTGKRRTRADCVDLYRRLMSGNICSSCGAVERQYACRSHVTKNWIQLRGKNLACWCPLDEPCHADVLLEIANNVSRELDRRDARACA